MTNVATLFETAKKVNNYAKDATGGGLWIDTTHFRCTVPAGKRWFLIGGFHQRDVSSTTNTRIYNSSDETLYFINAASAGTGIARILNYSQYGVTIPFVMDAGDYYEIVFGTAQGASAEASFVVLEVAL